VATATTAVAEQQQRLQKPTRIRISIQQPTIADVGGKCNFLGLVKRLLGSMCTSQQDA